MENFDRFWFDLNNVRRRGVWASSTKYLEGDLVKFGGDWHIGQSDHTSGESFAVDLAAGKWKVHVDMVTAAIPILTAQPSPMRAGMLVIADGTTWDPGSGAGLYRRNNANTSWVFVG